jgi:hypothetical protein
LFAGDDGYPQPLLLRYRPLKVLYGTADTKVQHLLHIHQRLIKGADGFPLPIVIDLDSNEQPSLWHTTLLLRGTRLVRRPYVLLTSLTDHCGSREPPRSW